jgi:dCMP deaminase
VARPNWDEYAIILAEAARTRSEDPYVQVGACILRHDKSVASVGYNGAPSGVAVDFSNRDERRPRMIHAEANALRYIRPGEGYLLATTLLPCLECLKLAASYGIHDVLYKENIENSDIYDTLLIGKIAKEFKVSLRQL